MSVKTETANLSDDLKTAQPLAASISPLDPAQIPISGAVSLGLGYAVRTGSMKNAAVKDDSLDKKSTSIRPEYLFEYVDSYSELAKVLNVSASASYGGAGVSGGSASLAMMQSTEMKSSSAYVVLKMRIIAKESTINTAYLTNEALRILNDQPPAQFYEKFGSKFIRTLYHGGELACVMEFSSTETISSETFRAEIRGAVGLAKAAGSTESSVMSLTGGRTVHIKYAQSGGTTGIAAKSGVFVATPEQLTERIKNFSDEVTGTTGLNGSTVPVYADVMDFKATLNWPPKRNDDLENPYPKEIENIAQSILVLQDQAAVVRGILTSPVPLAPGLLAAARELDPYLKFQTVEATRFLRAMMSNATGETQFDIESFHQYRIRNLLNVSSSASRANAGPSVDFTEPDKNLLKTRLFGSANTLVINPWPALEISGSWGFQGDRDDWGTGTRVACPQDGGNIQLTAERLAGKTGPNDGKFAFAQPYGTAYRDGGRCGYTVIHFTTIKVLHPDSNPLPDLPKIPSQPMNGATISPGAPVEAENNLWKIPFTVNMPCGTSCGSYELEIEIELIRDSGHPKTVKVTSYWYKESEPILSLMHPLTVEAGWKIASVSGTVVAAFCS